MQGKRSTGLERGSSASSTMSGSDQRTCKCSVNTTIGHHERLKVAERNTWLAFRTADVTI